MKNCIFYFFIFLLGGTQSIYCVYARTVTLEQKLEKTCTLLLSQLRDLKTPGASSNTFENVKQKVISCAPMEDDVWMAWCNQK